MQLLVIKDRLNYKLHPITCTLKNVINYTQLQLLFSITPSWPRRSWLQQDRIKLFENSRNFDHPVDHLCFEQFISSISMFIHRQKFIESQFHSLGSVTLGIDTTQGLFIPLLALWVFFLTRKLCLATVE